MKLLRDILYKVTLVSVAGDTGIDISNVCFDSRKVVKGSLFVAVKGTVSDGHEFIDEAVQKGASAVICERLNSFIDPSVTYIVTDNSAKALAYIADNFYGKPSSKLKLVAVTGTNGKTTTATLLHQLFIRLGYNAGLLSTVVNKINQEELPATHTTPDPIALNELLVRMVDENCTHCFMEASSHAIDQHRVTGLDLDGAIFTNISHDHLDYHGTFDEYIKAKKRLFDFLPENAFALTNLDEKRGMVMLQNTKATKTTYSLKGVSDFKAKIISNTIQGLEMDVDGRNVWFKLIGDFNAYNILAVYGTAVLLGEDKDEVLAKLSDLHPAPGRFEQVPSNKGIIAIVDYAHTPDALENVLGTIHKFRTGNEKVVTVIGCGGNRDKTKRPLMAEIACKLSDVVILTSDNPRFEEPEEIINDMKAGVSPSNYKKASVITDRKQAIEKACEISVANDIILVAGKGHETYQEIKGVKYPFDDRIVLRNILHGHQ